MNGTNSIQWEIDQLVKARLFPDEESVLKTALRSLFQSKPELKRKMIVSAYTQGEISLGKAAQLLAVCLEEMKEIIVESGAKIHLGPRAKEELNQDIANA